MQHTFSVTFGMLNGSSVTFWSDFTKARLFADEKWSNLGEINFEKEVGSKIIFVFKTTAVYGEDEENDKSLEPWQQNEESAPLERPCTWTLRMEHAAWIRTIYFTDEEAKARVPN